MTTVGNGQVELSTDGWSPAPLATLVTATGLAAVLLATTAGGLAPGWGSAVGPAAVVLAGLLGLPHGAVDHLALGWVRGRTGAARPVVLLAYAVAALSAAALALAAPLPALLALLVLSAAHFAEGEAAYDRLRGGPGLALPAAARPLLVALAPTVPTVLAPVRLPVLVLTAALVVAALVVALRAGRLLVATELVVVVGGAVAGPPLLAFAVWFGLWHSPRHLVRLLALQPGGSGRVRGRRLAVGAAAPTAVAAGGLVGLTLVVGGLPGAVLLVLLALTVPHAAVVARLDALRRG